MDPITHQSLRKQCYGSNSSLRNDSLKHMRKHERKEGGIKPKSKEPRHWRTVRLGGTDCPHGPRGLSGLSRELSEKANRTSSSDPWRNGLSVGWSRTVRLPADCPLLCCGLSKTSSNQNSKTKRIENEDEQEHDEHTKNSSSRGPSTTSSRTVRASRIEAKTARPRRSTPPTHHRISQMVEVVETRVRGHDMRQPRMLYPKTFAS
jgi:hypothetical protein